MNTGKYINIHAPGSHSKQVKHWSDFILKTGII